MKKKLNKFLVDIDNEDLDMFSSQTKPIKNTHNEDKNDKISNLAKKENTILFDDPLTIKNKDILFSDVKEINNFVKKEETNEKLSSDTNINKNKKPFTFKSTLLYDDEDEDILFKNKFKDKDKVPEEKSKNNIPPLIDFSFAKNQNESRDNKYLDLNDEIMKPVKLTKTNTNFDPLSVFSDIDFNKTKEKSILPNEKIEELPRFEPKNLFNEDKNIKDTSKNLSSSTRFLDEINNLFENTKATDISHKNEILETNKIETKIHEEKEINQIVDEIKAEIAVEENKPKEIMKEEREDKEDKELFSSNLSEKKELNKEKIEKKIEDEKITKNIENPLENIIKNINSGLSENFSNKRGSVKKEIKINFLEDDIDDPLSTTIKKPEIKKEKPVVIKKENIQNNIKKEKKQDSSDEDDLFTKNLKKNEKNSLKSNFEETLKSRFSEIQKKLSDNNNHITPFQSINEHNIPNTYLDTVKDTQIIKEDTYGDIIVNKLSSLGPKKTIKKKSTLKRFEHNTLNNEILSAEKLNLNKEETFNIPSFTNIGDNYLKSYDEINKSELMVIEQAKHCIQENDLLFDTENKNVVLDHPVNELSNNLNTEINSLVNEQKTEIFKHDIVTQKNDNEIDNLNEEPTNVKVEEDTTNNYIKSNEIIEIGISTNTNNETVGTQFISSNLNTQIDEKTIHENIESVNENTLIKSSEKEESINYPENNIQSEGNILKSEVKEFEFKTEIKSDPIKSQNEMTSEMNGKEQISQIKTEEKEIDNIKEIQAKIFSNIKVPQEKKLVPKKITLAFDDDD